MNMTTLSALAEPNRLHIVELLREGPLSVGEIAEHLQLIQPKVSKHLRVLGDAGIVEVQPIAQMRIYKLRPQTFNELNTWMQSFRLIWDERFDQLDDFLHQFQNEGLKIDE
jgi:DNA-binding transcriptional ArsR family regulator